MKKNQHSIEADKLKGVLITRTAIKTLIPEDIVEKVIMFQFKDIKDGTYTHEQIEVSGFGKFLISNSKLKKRKQKVEDVLVFMSKRLEEGNAPEAKLILWAKMIETTKENLAYLKTKKGGYENKHKGDTGGSMELPIREGGDREDSKTEG